MKPDAEASLRAKDHILHFRCYVQLGQTDEALRLFRRLAPEAGMVLVFWGGRLGRKTRDIH
jgi:pentatricopeptide repeat protein